MDKIETIEVDEAQGRKPFHQRVQEQASHL